MQIGVLALQGDFREHAVAIERCGVGVSLVKRVEELSAIDALIIPGGESTTIAHLAKVFDLFEAISERIRSGLPTYGSCAGMILVADHILGAVDGQETFGGLDVTVRRNAFGRQVDSFESTISFNGQAIEAVFIRAPWVESVGEGVDVLSTITIDGTERPVAVRNKHVLATSFHPELTESPIVHRYFLEEMVR